MNLLVFIGQGNKYIYDSFAAEKLVEVANPKEFMDISNLFLFNQICMFTDSVVICLAALSLLKYTSLANPDVKIIIETVAQFFMQTFLKTMPMIILSYMLFGMISHYILAYYQYGFFF
jgi:hypothetical protein